MPISVLRTVAAVPVRYFSTRDFLPPLLWSSEHWNKQKLTDIRVRHWRSSTKQGQPAVAVAVVIAVAIAKRLSTKDSEMPFVCTATGEMSIEGLSDAEVTVRTSPRSLASHTVVTGRAKNGQIETWVWKDDKELSPEERVQLLRLKEGRRG